MKPRRCLAFGLEFPQKLKRLWLKENELSELQLAMMPISTLQNAPQLLMEPFACPLFSVVARWTRIALVTLTSLIAILLMAFAMVAILWKLELLTLTTMTTCFAELDTLDT